MAIPSTEASLSRGTRRETFVAHPMPRVTLPAEARRGRRRAAAKPVPLIARVALVAYLAAVGFLIALAAAFVTPDAADSLAVVAGFSIITAAGVLAGMRIFR